MLSVYRDDRHTPPRRIPTQFVKIDETIQAAEVRLMNIVYGCVSKCVSTYPPWLVSVNIFGRLRGPDSKRQNICCVMLQVTCVHSHKALNSETLPQFIVTSKSVA